MSGTTNIPVVSVIFRRDNKILFVLRENTTWMSGFYGLPAGHVEDNESFRQAACREVKEEVGLEIKPEQLEHKLTFHQLDERGGVRVGIYFEATEWSGEPYNAEPHKHKEIAWLEADHLPETVLPTTRQKLEVIKTGQPYAEFDWEK